MADVRERALEVLDGLEDELDDEDPLLAGGFAYEMLIAHVLQVHARESRALLRGGGPAPRMLLDRSRAALRAQSGPSTSPGRSDRLGQT